MSSRDLYTHERTIYFFWGGIIDVTDDMIDSIVLQLISFCSFCPGGLLLYPGSLKEVSDNAWM